MLYGKEKKKKNNLKVGEEDMKLSVFVDGIFVYIEDSKESSANV